MTVPLQSGGKLHTCRNRHQHSNLPGKKGLVGEPPTGSWPAPAHSPRRSPPDRKSSRIHPLARAGLFGSRRSRPALRQLAPQGPTRNPGGAAEPHLLLSLQPADALFIGGDLNDPFATTFFSRMLTGSASLWADAVLKVRPPSRGRIGGDGGGISKAGWQGYWM